MNITPEMARAELQRRQSLSGSSSSTITPEMARAELERRKLLNSSSPKPEASQEEGFLDYAKRGLARHARNLAISPLDQLDFLATPVRGALNLGAKALGMDYEFKPVGEEVAKGIDTLTGGYTAPRTPQEKTSAEFVRGAGAVPSGFALGTVLKNIKNAPNAIKSLGDFYRGSNVINPTNVLTAGAVPAIIQSTLNENPENVGEAVGKGVAGGVAIPLAQGLLSTLTKKGRTSAAARTGEFFKINPEAVENFERAGVTPTLPDVSKGKIPKLAISTLENTPLSSDPIIKARNLQREEILSQLGQGDFGKNLSRGEAGKLAVKGAREYQKGKQKEFSSMFSKVEKDIESLGDDTIGLENTNKYFDSLLKNIKTKSQQNRFESSPLGKMYVDLYETAQQNKGRIPYHDMKERLDHINDMITTHGQIGKVTQGKLKQFSSTISKDIEDSLDPRFKGLGDESYKNWKEAKKYYAQYAQEDIPKLNELYKKDKKGATDSFIDIITNQKKGAEKAKIALQGLSHPDQIDLTDAIHKHLGRKTDGTFSPLKWSREFKALEPEAQKILLSPMNEGNREKIKYISDVMDHLKSTLEEANTSKTAYHTALGALGTAAYHGTTSLISGNPYPIAKLATGLFMGRLISDKIMTNPKFINWMYKGMKAKNMDHFERNLSRIPKIGKLTKALQRSAQTFQHDLSSARNEKEKE